MKEVLLWQQIVLIHQRVQQRILIIQKRVHLIHRRTLQIQQRALQILQILQRIQVRTALRIQLRVQARIQEIPAQTVTKEWLPWQPYINYRIIFFLLLSIVIKKPFCVI